LRLKGCVNGVENPAVIVVAGHAFAPPPAGTMEPARTDQTTDYAAFAAFWIAFRIAPERLQCRLEIGTAMSGNRNILYLIIGALIVGIGLLGYNLYAVKKEPSGLQINVGPDGLKIQNK
jgi:hypothetical protein